MPKELNEKLYRCSIKRMPKPIRDFILREQNDIKVANGIQFSMEATIIKLLYTHPKYKGE